MSEDESKVPTDRGPDPVVRALEKLVKVVSLVHVAVGSTSRALHTAIEQFSTYHGERKAQEQRINRKLDRLMQHLGCEYHEPPPEAENTPTNGRRLGQ